MGRASSIVASVGPRARRCLLASMLASACSIPLGKLGDVADDQEGEPGSTAGSELPPESDRIPVLEVDDGALDVLFVIDNSGSMGPKQARVTRAIRRFTADAMTAGLDVRLGFTTTDNGNPWCGTTGPEAGALRLSSCRSRPQEFTFNGESVIVSFDEACGDLCEPGRLDLDIQPTSTHLDAAPAPRPWLEATSTSSNISDATIEQAVGCVAPQGIDGCGFESPLESMWKTLERSDDDFDPARGFLRPWARLVVVFVTDEIDCSADQTWVEIFLPEGNRVFWSTPDTGAPTSAVCWNAGVACRMDGDEISDCEPQDYDASGRFTEPANAVMYSLGRYVERLEEVEQSKANYRPERSVGVVLLGGVPVGYGEDQAELVYSTSSADPAFVDDFGIGPGCSSESGDAVPPVRLRVLAEQFTVGGRDAVYSVCREDFGPALDTVLRSVSSARLQRACVPGCLADVDDGTPGTQVECRVVLERGTPTEREAMTIPACDDASPEFACYRLALDDNASECAEQGSNADLQLELAPGAEFQGQLTVDIACAMAPAGSC